MKGCFFALFAQLEAKTGAVGVKQCCGFLIIKLYLLNFPHDFTKILKV
jgi:hypothetical protein